MYLNLLIFYLKLNAVKTEMAQTPIYFYVPSVESSLKNLIF